MITAPTVHQQRTTEPVKAAVADFFRTHYPSLLRVVLYAGGRWEEAEDAVSATMDELLVNWQKIEKPAAWARRAVLHHFVKARQRDRDRREREASPKAPRPAIEGGEAELSFWEDREWVLQLLNDLAPAQRAVVALLVDEFSQKEIAEILGKTPAAVRQNLAAARGNLKSKLPVVGDPKPLVDEPSALAGSEMR